MDASKDFFVDQVQVSFFPSFPRLGKPVRQRLMWELRLRLALCRAVKDRSRPTSRLLRHFGAMPKRDRRFGNDVPTQHAQWIEVETRSCLKGGPPPIRRQMLRQNAIEAWMHMQKTGWVRCQPWW